MQVELDPERQLKIKSEFFLKRVNISANQMISGDSKGVNNKGVNNKGVNNKGVNNRHA